MLRTNVELTVEDIEALLDVIGPPGNESENLEHARMKLIEALKYLKRNLA